MKQLELTALFHATLETIYLVFTSSIISILLGGCLGIILFLTQDKQALGNKTINRTIGLIVNTTRSVPFIILMISILPLTRAIVGTTIGTNAAIVPLTLAAIPFFARITENALSEIPLGLIETANAYGATTYQLVSKILIPESMPALIRGMTLTIIALIGYSAMAGAVGGGGLGQLAINYGYQRFNAIVTLETVIILIVLVQLIQYIGDKLANKSQIKTLVTSIISIAIVCMTGHFYLATNKSEDVVKVGVIAGWSEDIMRVAEQVADKKYHLKVKTIAFTGYTLPNTALANGDIDANIFQHIPYLNAQKQKQHLPIHAAAKTFVYPMGFYSKKITSIQNLPFHARIAIPNDPSNESRALLLLQKAGLIQLHENATDLVTLRSITDNPKQLQFVPINAAQLPRALNDAELVALTNDFITSAGYTIKQALLAEGADSSYANVIAVRNENDNRINTLIQVMHSTPVLKATLQHFPDGAAIPAW